MTIFKPALSGLWINKFRLFIADSLAEQFACTITVNQKSTKLRTYTINSYNNRHDLKIFYFIFRYLIFIPFWRKIYILASMPYLCIARAFMPRNKD